MATYRITYPTGCSEDMEGRSTNTKGSGEVTHAVIVEDRRGWDTWFLYDDHGNADYDARCLRAESGYDDAMVVPVAKIGG